MSTSNRTTHSRRWWRRRLDKEHQRKMARKRALRAQRYIERTSSEEGRLKEIRKYDQ